ncbi:MAG: glycine dehydrogenase subunit 2 [Alphaproteobacteria bacterium]|nr:glycine dehydrogenase subunit 2 [Alphaproteobacteria bacterium]
MCELNTVSGNKALQIEEGLIFEQGEKDRTAVELQEIPEVKNRLGGLERNGEIGLPGLSEPQVVRHYTRLSNKNYGVDTGFYPLGSCTMKYNPRINEKMARIPGFADVHPFQPEETVQGALELLDTTAGWLTEVTGMAAVALSPAAGAHGELCGMQTIRAAHMDKDTDEGRKIVLTPDSSHGTNPATATLCGYKTETLKSKPNGKVDLDALKERLSGDKGKNVAAFMLTNPNTCGLFENDIIEISEIVHEAGAYFYMDGANFNAIVGRVRIVDLGVDAMHINVHKTFSTPHGGGGPGAGPTVLAESIAKYAPLPYVTYDGENSFHMVETPEEAEVEGNKPYGRMRGFHGQFGVLVRTLSYLLAMGGEGLKQASTDAVLNANYLRAKLQDVMSVPFSGICMHEVLFDDSFLKGTDVTTLDFAKALIDEGYHPMTVYFPLVVHGAMLVEPNETETKQDLDKYVEVITKLTERAKSGDAEYFKAAPVHAPRRRLDETKAARNPNLRWTPEA